MTPIAREFNRTVSRAITGILAIGMVLGGSRSVRRARNKAPGSGHAGGIINMEVKHTPGPWEAKWSKYSEGEFIVQTKHASNRVIASFDDDGDGAGEQSIADARLIAAAPDLLAMLKVAQLWLDIDGRFDMQGINAAIAKAEGRS